MNHDPDSLIGMFAWAAYHSHPTDTVKVADDFMLLSVEDRAKWRQCEQATTSETLAAIPQEYVADFARAIKKSKERTDAEGLPECGCELCVFNRAVIGAVVLKGRQDLSSLFSAARTFIKEARSSQ